MKRKTTIIIVTAIICAIVAWLFAAGPFAKHETADTEAAEEMERVRPAGPAFNADSAYAFTKAQCDFGPRDMNSRGHERCLEWIVAKFKQYGCKVTTQKANLAGWDGTMLHSTNIIARFNPEATTRIMLCAHWDSRPWADNDPDSLNWRKPILAANDAASGVAVMLELARLLDASQDGASLKNKEERIKNKEADAQVTNHKANSLSFGGGRGETSKLKAQSTKLKAQSSKHQAQSLGIDFVCFDAEDWGTPQWSDHQDDGSSWALGAQYWAANLPQGYAPRYAILLDMVGGQGAQFYREGMSQQYAPEIVKKVWRAARQAGYGSFFPRQDGGMITDDHIPVNQVAKIPCIDVIPYYPECQQSSFGPTWHTLADDMDHIDKNTLKAVGQTMVQVIFTEL